jgi:DNA mismatch repair ATPase MutS
MIITRNLQLATGRLKPRNGIYLACLTGCDETILSSAREILGQLGVQIPVKEK